MLNPEQLAAVRHEGGHLLIVAGPGTGKTATLTRRIAANVSRLAEGQKILAITFTNKAAAEVSARLASLDVPADKVDAGTFHAFSLQVLRRYQNRLSFPLTFSIASPDDVEALARSFWPSRSGTERRTLLKKIADWKASLAPSTNDPDIDSFRAMLREKRLVDFDDILRDAVLLLREQKDVAGEIHRTYPLIFVDEYQDVSAVQVALLKELVGAGVFLTAIGDPHQAIYGFRGSDVRYFQDFEKTFVPSAVLHLSRNYRSGADLVAAGGQVIARGEPFPVTPLTAEIHAKGLLKVRSCPTDKAEAEYVAHTIERLVGGVSSFSRASGRVQEEGGSRSFGDIAVLYRLNAQGRLIAGALERLGVPFQVSGDKGLALSPAVRAALQATSPKDNVLEILSRHRQTDPDVDAHWDYLFAMAADARTVGEFLDRAALQTPEDQYLYKTEKVSLMTLHASKGLEFPVVFLAGCEEGVVPLSLAPFSCDPQEERRLFYVGMTRAKEELYLLYARRRLLYGQTLEQEPSRFIFDIERSLKAFEKESFREARRDPGRDQMKLF